MKTIETLLPDLVSKTVAGSLTWKKRAPAKSGYEVLLARYYIVIWEWSDPESETEGITVSIHDLSDEQIDYITVDQFSSRYAKFLEAYQTARRSALGLDRVIDEIETALDNLIPF